MRNVGLGLLAVLVMAGSTTTAAAGQTTASLLRYSDHNGARELAEGNDAAAARVLAESLRVAPHAPDLLLNMAAIRARQGRVAEARALYAEVEAQPSEAMVLPSGGSAMSHDMAARGLARLQAAVLASR